MTTNPAATTPTTTTANTAGKPAATATAGAAATPTTPTTTATAGAKATTPPAAIGTAGTAAVPTTATPTTAAGGSSAATAGAAPAATGGTGATATGGTSAAAGGSAAAAGGGAVAPTVEGFPAESSCLADITDFTKDGPFKFMAASDGATKMWVPMVPAGCKVPVVHLANGTGASCSNYQGSLNRMATHGFISACYENTNTGAGTQGVTAFKAVIAKYPDLVAKRLGSTGHSQGGQGSFTALALAEAEFGPEYVYAGLAMQPASGFGTQPSGGSWQSVYKKIKSPMFMFSGTADMLVSQGWVQQGFDALDDTIEAYHWSAIGATHIPTPDKEEMEMSIPWFRWKLLGDKKACEHFKKMPEGGKWKVVKEQNAKGCE